VTGRPSSFPRKRECIRPWVPAFERVKEFDIERFPILRQARDEEMDGILPFILSPVEGCGPRFDAATDSLTCSNAGTTKMRRHKS
jgi:hypothetical protein